MKLKISDIFNIIKWLNICMLVLLSAGGCSYQGAHLIPEQPHRLTILHTNDHHGRFYHNKNGEYGMAARKTVIDQIRAEVESRGGTLLLLSAGDINTGVPESDMQDAEPDFKAMNILGYDAMVVGNHEFDNPRKVLDKQQGWAHFPFLSANIYSDISANRMFKPHVLFEKKGLSIAVLGLTTKDTAVIGNPEYVRDIDFRDPIAEARSLVPALVHQENPDVMIALTHMGYYENGTHGVNAPGDVSLARSLEQGAVDIIVGGHTHDPVCMRTDNVLDTDYQPGTPCQPDYQNGSWIVQAYEWGKYVGRADFIIQNGTVELEKYELVPVNLPKKETDGEQPSAPSGGITVSEDKGLLEFFGPYLEQGRTLLDKQAGIVNGRFEGDRDVIRFKQTNLGRLIATAQMERAGADCGVVNSGGIRASLEEGLVTYKDILVVQPFANTLTYTDMSGAELVDYIRKVASKPVDTGGYAQFAAVSLIMRDEEEADVVVGEEKVKPSGTYRIAVPSYNAAGGDGYPPLVDHPGFVDTGFVDAEILKSFIEANTPLNPDTFKAEPVIINMVEVNP